jgi:hypothetical protein
MSYKNFLIALISLFFTTSVIASELFYSEQVPNTKWEVFGSLKNGKVNATCKMEQQFNNGAILLAKDLHDNEIYLRIRNDEFDFSEKSVPIKVLFLKGEEVIGPYDIDAIVTDKHSFVLPNLNEVFVSGWISADKFSFRLPNKDIYSISLDGTKKALDYVVSCVKSGGSNPNEIRGL